jgi:hypothetical protein
MRTAAILSALALLGALPAAPLAAKEKQQWVYNGRAYDSYEQCREARKKSKARAAIVGAAAAGGVAAIAGGNLGETALVAGAGALAGSVIGKNAKKC